MKMGLSKWVTLSATPAVHTAGWMLRATAENIKTEGLSLTIIFMAMRAPMSFLALTAMIGFMAAAAATPMTAGRVMTASVTALYSPCLCLA